MVSSELPEIIGMSDRVMVVHEGRMAGILDNLSGDNSTDHQKVMQENIMILATGGKLE
jgi:ribose transport system ATP-binding protein